MERGGNGDQEPSVPSWLASPAPMSTVVSGEDQTPALFGHELQPWSMRAEATRDLALRLGLRSSRSKADSEGLLLAKAHDLKRGSAVRPLTECFTDGFCACIAAAWALRMKQRRTSMGRCRPSVAAATGSHWQWHYSHWPSKRPKQPQGTWSNRPAPPSTSQPPPSPHP